jgi:CRP/FNR family transcriptional regulator, cyclic AMP receptor protein
MLVSSFVSQLSSDEAAGLRSLGHLREAPRRQALLSEGELPDSVLLIERGNAKIISVTRDGDEVVLALRGAGELVGEQSILDGRPRAATVVAIDPLEVRVIPGADFVRFLKQNPRVMLVVISMMSAALRAASLAQISYAAADTLGRVAARLLELGERFGEPSAEGIRVALPLTQEEIAGWAGASLEATARALRQMRELGWIDTGRRALLIRDRDALRRRAP